jgi:hypothetical protein
MLIPNMVDLMSLGSIKTGEGAALQYCIPYGQLL